MVWHANTSSSGPVTAVILAGRISTSSARTPLDLHALCLPVGPHGTLLDAWVDTLASADTLAEVRVVLNTPQDVEAVTAAAAQGANPRMTRPRVRVIAEPAAWRGAGGILRDVTRDAPDEAIVLVCEGKRLPPASVEPMIATMKASAPASGVVGVCGSDEPAGLCAFTRRALSRIPDIGYFDLKEQFIPLLRRCGEQIAAAWIGPQVWRIHDLETYLAAVKRSLQCESHPSRQARIAATASISGSAVLDGCCVIEPGAVVEDGAVVHDSVLLQGATVGGGAVVSRSVVAPLAAIEPRTRVAHSFVARVQPLRNGTRFGRARLASGAPTLW